MPTDALINNICQYYTLKDKSAVKAPLKMRPGAILIITYRCVKKYIIFASGGDQNLD